MSGEDATTNMNVTLPHRFELNVENPSTFVDDFTKKTEKVAFVNAMSEPAIVAIVSDKGAIEIETELISVTTFTGLLTVDLNSVPCRRDEAVSVGKEICNVVGISSTKLAAWRNTGTESSQGVPSVLQTGRNQVGGHAVEIRKSFEDSAGWRVLYTLSIATSPESKAVFELIEDANGTREHPTPYGKPTDQQ